jgi:hypothetical protein
VSSEEVDGDEVGIEDSGIEAGEGDRDADIVLGKMDAEVMNETTVLHNEIEEVVAATPPLRR